MFFFCYETFIRNHYYVNIITHNKPEIINGGIYNGDTDGDTNYICVIFSRILSSPILLLFLS